MSAALPRLKPNPIPAVHPLPEYLADGARKDFYEDTKAVLQVPWMGVVTMAFSHYPHFYGCLWGGLRDLAASREWADACGALRAKAESEAAALGPAPLRGALADIGYAPRELDEIKAMIEVFSHGNMPYMTIATAARLLLEGRALSERTETTPSTGRHGPSDANRLTLVERHHADASTVAVYDDIQGTLGLPFVNTDYRALARWPSYFARAWGDLQPKIADASYEKAVTAVHDTVVGNALTLANPGGLSPDALIAAAEKDGDLKAITDTVRLFQWLLPGLAVNVAYFRAQLHA